MGGAVERVQEIIWKITEDSFANGRKQERERIIEMLEAVKGEVSADFESQIEGIIQELRKEIK